MNDPSFAVGLVLWVGGVMILTFAYLSNDGERRGKLRIRDLSRRANREGLRGRYHFVEDRTKWISVGGFGTYAPADAEDGVKYSAVGSRIEANSLLFGNQLVWTKARLAWVGVPLLLVGATVCAFAAYG